MATGNHVTGKSHRSITAGESIGHMTFVNLTPLPLLGAPSLIEYKQQKFLIINNPTPATLPNFIHVSNGKLLPRNFIFD